MQHVLEECFLNVSMSIKGKVFTEEPKGQNSLLEQETMYWKVSVFSIQFCHKLIIPKEDGTTNVLL